MNSKRGCTKRSRRTTRSSEAMPKKVSGGNALKEVVAAALSLPKDRFHLLMTAVLGYREYEPGIYIKMHRTGATIIDARRAS